MVQRKFLITARLFFGLLTLVAIGVELVIDIQGGHSLVNFFSFFTDLSNIFAAIVLIIGAIHLIKHRQPTVAEDIIRGSSVAYMALVGIVFGVLLRDVDLGDLLPWVNTVTHYIMPIVVVLDWLYQPPKSKLSPKQLWLWLIFPVASSRHRNRHPCKHSPLAQRSPWPKLASKRNEDQMAGDKPGHRCACSRQCLVPNILLSRRSQRSPYLWRNGPPRGRRGLSGRNALTPRSPPG